MNYIRRLSCLYFFITLFFTNAAYAVSGDIRGGYFNKEDVDDGEYRLRARIGHSIKFDESWMARARLAGRYSSDPKNDYNLEFFRGIPPGKDGLSRGDTTIDELYVQYSDDNNQLRIGRQQTKMELVGVARKSLDRNTSPNTDIAWTDGIYWKHKHSNGWTGHAIMQYNYGKGSSEVRRKPLDFSDSGSRVSTMIAIDKTSKTDFWAQRSFAISYLPNSLHTQGINAGAIDDYLTVVGRLAAQWPMANKTKFLLAGEMGYAPNTPDRSTFSLPGNGSTNGTAWQASFNFIDFAPHHSIGFLMARSEAGWLISPDFRSNNNLFEVRYRWMISKTLKFEIRGRRREQIDKPTTSTKIKVDEDSYFRLTWKF